MSFPSIVTLLSLISVISICLPFTQDTGFTVIVNVNVSPGATSVTLLLTAFTDRVGFTAFTTNFALLIPSDFFALVYPKHARYPASLALAANFLSPGYPLILPKFVLVRAYKSPLPAAPRPVSK